MRLNNRESGIKRRIGQLENLTDTSGALPMNRHRVCQHHHESNDYSTHKTPLKSIGSKLAPLTPLKGSASRAKDLRAAANLRTAAINSLERTGNTTKNA